MTMRDHSSSLVVAGVLAAVILAGCSPDFEPFSQITNLRVMAIGGETPSIAPGETTTLSALVHASDGQTVSYAWDWCPFATGASNEYECRFEAPPMDGEMAEADPDAPAIPEFDFALGTGPEVEFAYPLPPEALRQLCDAVQSAEDVPAFIQLPKCDESFPVKVRLVVTQPNGERVVAVKSMELLYEAPSDPADRNTNPQILGVSIGDEGAKRDDAEVMLEDEAFEVEYEKTYTLLLDVDEAIAETFVRADDDGVEGEFRENLSVIWFQEDGEPDEDRSAFVDGFRTFDDLTTNTLKMPAADEFEDEEMMLFFVIQDERGGIGWTTRTVRFKR